MDILNDFISSTLIDVEGRPKKYSFGSCYPPCPRQAMFGFREEQEGESFTFYNRYRSAVGSAARNVVIKTWAEQGLLWGDWRCVDLKCGVVYQNNRLEGGVCIRCGSPAQYVAKTFDEPEFKGRCDAIVFHPGMDGYLVFKIKSRNTSVIMRTEHPYPSDVTHLSACATLLSRQRWLRVAGRAVLWIGTPRPEPFKCWHYAGVGEEMYDENERILKDVRRRMALGEDIPGHCESREHAPFQCMYRDQCFGKEE